MYIHFYKLVYITLCTNGKISVRLPSLSEETCFKHYLHYQFTYLTSCQPERLSPSEYISHNVLTKSRASIIRRTSVENYLVLAVDFKMGILTFMKCERGYMTSCTYKLK